MNVSAAHVRRFLKSTGKLLYIVHPNDTTFEHPERVPNYWEEIWLPFFLLLILEQIALCIKYKKKVRWNDQVNSLSHWIFDETVRFFSRGAEYYIYLQLYNKYHLLDLAWNAPSTWIIAALSVEFCYYWAHRCNHEITFFWIFHQVHHSSEEFTLAVGLRQSIMQSWCNLIFYLPLTLFVPPSHFVAHKQLNLIYQLCLHTTLIGDIKGLDWFFNTAKHHRVHHGCNLYCLDKNYGGVLIIWDRLFGTFQEERDEIVYGLVINSESFNPLYLQLFYLKAMLQKSATMCTWWNKVGTFWKGPSWFPGAPRLGLDRYKTYVMPRDAYDPCIPAWQLLYIFSHFALIVCNFHRLRTTNSHDFPAACMVLDYVFALIDIGLLFDGDNRVAPLELLRCVFCVNITPCNRSVLDTCVYVLNAFSLYCIWIPRVLKLMTDYAHEYTLLVRSRKMKVRSSLRSKLLYIAKGFLRKKHVKCKIVEFPGENEDASSEPECSSLTSKYSDTVSEASTRIRRLFLSH